MATNHAVTDNRPARVLVLCCMLSEYGMGPYIYYAKGKTVCLAMYLNLLRKPGAHFRKLLRLLMLFVLRALLLRLYDELPPAPPHPSASSVSFCLCLPPPARLSVSLFTSLTLSSSVYVSPSLPPSLPLSPSRSPPLSHLLSLSTPLALSVTQTYLEHAGRLRHEGGDEVVQLVRVVLG